MASLEELLNTYFNDARLCSADITRYCIQPLIELRTPGVYIKRVVHAASLSALSTMHVIAINYDGKFIVTDHSAWQETPAKCRSFDIQTGILTDFPLIEIPAYALLEPGRHCITWITTGSSLVVNYRLTHSLPKRIESTSVLPHISIQKDDNGQVFVRFMTPTGINVDIYGRYITSGQTRKFVYISTFTGCDYIVNIINRKTGNIIRKHAIDTLGMSYDMLPGSIEIKVFQCGKYIVLAYRYDHSNTCWNVFVFTKHGRKVRRMTIESELNVFQEILAYPNTPKFAVICSKIHHTHSDVEIYAKHVDVYEIEEIKRTMYV